MPVRVVMQCPAPQLAEADWIANAQLTRRVTEFTWQAAIEVELQEAVFLRQAGEGIRPRHITGPQHQMLTCAIAQWTLRGEAQAQYAGAQPIDGRDFGRAAILLRVEGVHLQILDHLALACQPPALLALLRTQGIGPAVARQPLHALHQARMATAGTTAVRH